MKILGIDTSSKILSIAVSEDKDVILEESHLLDRKHSSLLVPKIDGLLKKTRIKIHKIDAFVIGLGPGSFTGLRIGVSTVKGFGIALQRPCIGVVSLDGIACNATTEGLIHSRPTKSRAKRGETMALRPRMDNGRSPRCRAPRYPAPRCEAVSTAKQTPAFRPEQLIIPIIDAKREQVYAAIYTKKVDRVIRESGYLLMPIEKLMKRIKGDAVFLGDGVDLYGEKISNLNKNAIFLEEKYWYPSAGNLIKLGFIKIKKAKKLGLDKLVPMYMYPEDCQVKKS